MSQHYNETLEQRKKAQRDFLELKKMQQGEIPIPEKRKDQAPATFWGKVANFWYHYRAVTIISVCIAVVIAIGVAQCANRVQYDANVVLYTKNYYTDEHCAALEGYLSRFFNDTNSDGAVNVNLINCSYTTEGQFDSQYVNAKAQLLQATMSSEASAQIFIVDKETFDQLNAVPNSLDAFFVESFDMPQSMYAGFSTEQYPFPEGLIVARRVVEGTLIENKKNIGIYNAQNDEAFQKMQAE